MSDGTILMLNSVICISMDVLNVDLSSLSEVILEDLAASDIQVRTVLEPFEH